MSLKVFHIFFIIVCIGLCAFLGVWGVRENSTHPNAFFLTLGIGSMLTGAGLVLYLGWVLRKLRSFGFFGVTVSWAMLHPVTAEACTVCLGNPNSPLVKAANTGVLALLYIIGTVLVGFAVLFATWVWRSRRQNKRGNRETLALGALLLNIFIG